MRRQSAIQLFGYAIVMALTLAVASALAQENVEAKIEARISAMEKKIEAACSTEIKKWCSTVTPGQARLINCLVGYLSQVSAKCDSTLSAEVAKESQALGHMWDIADACAPDIQKYCANLAEDRVHTAQCLVDQKASLTLACRSKINKLFPSALQ